MQEKKLFKTFFFCNFAIENMNIFISTKSSYMKKITTLAVAALAIAMASCTNKDNTPEKVVNNFYQATQNNEFDKAMEYTNLAEEERAQVVEIIGNTGMVIHEFSVIDSRIEEGDSTAWVSLHLVVSNAFRPDTVGNDLEIPCVKVDKQWKVKFM